MAASNADLFKSGEYSDQTVRCGDSEWKQHRVIHCPLSLFFATAEDEASEASKNASIFFSLDCQKIRGKR